MMAGQNVDLFLSKNNLSVVQKQEGQKDEWRGDRSHRKGTKLKLLSIAHELRNEKEKEHPEIIAEVGDNARGAQLNQNMKKAEMNLLDLNLFIYFDSQNNNSKASRSSNVNRSESSEERA
jgi:hypothetical protein